MNTLRRCTRRIGVLAVLLLLTAGCSTGTTGGADTAGGADPADGATGAGDAREEGEQTTPEAREGRQELPPSQLERLPGQADVPRDRSLQVGFLVVDGVYNSELMAPYDIFQHTIFHTDPGMEVFTVSPDGSPVTTFEGLVIEAHHGFDTAPPIDVLVVPSAEHSMDTDLENETMIAWVREVGERASFIVSLCDGAFVLAEAGLLDDVVSTTFPGDADRYEEMFPHLETRRGVSFVHDGKALTSQGGAKSYDVAMYLVDHILGEDVARGVGQGLIIPWPPAPGTMTAELVAAR